MRSAAAALAVCALLFACNNTRQTSGGGAMDVQVSYPSSAAYDAARRVLLVGSYANGSITSITTHEAGRDGAGRLPNDGRQNILRIRIDPPRERIWVLASNGLYVYDARNSSLLRRVDIGPLTQHSNEHCLPDMAIDPAGTVFVSNAMRPELISVDAATFELTQREVYVDADRNLDFGFSALTFSGVNDELYAASATSGTLWKIDTVENRATKIPLPERLTGACALHADDRFAQANESGVVLYVAGGFRDGLKRVQLSATTPARVSNVATAVRSLAPTDLLTVKRDLLVVSSQLNEHPDFNGDGHPNRPFKIISLRMP